ncbi:hypothetical protein CEP54_000273 [Fusarium duplospermum]|uniref:Uncharacterized protein n=1 Tax=Fusarium duplospermum TaxID=1325734 RepID=A0A428R8K8_9HYPO|nr:hypothetical protein CEP54_000273 [Fusarium duplospermum]
MFGSQAQANRLVSITEDVINDKNAKFQGIVKVLVEDLVFAPDLMSCEHNTNPAKVSRLKRIFNTEGCNRSDSANFIVGDIRREVLSEAMRLSNLTPEDLRGGKEPRMLYLPRFQYIQCASGRSRVRALLETPQFGPWWTVELYCGLSPKTFDIIAEDYLNEGRHSHGHICERIVYHRSKDLTEERRWWARLTKSAADILKRVLKHPSLSPPFLKLIMNIPGLREGFEIGTWHKIIGAKCDEEVIRYMEFTFDFWVKLMGSTEALSFVDSEDVREFQLRVPGVSQLDFHYLATLVMSGNAFKRLTDESKRNNLIIRMKDIKYLIPSIYTLQKDFKYLRQCTDTLKRLLYGKNKPPFTAQTLAYDAFSPKTPSGPDCLFYERMKRLYLFIMQDLVELTGEWPRLEDGEEPPDRLVRLPGSWYRLANKAVQLGFQSDEIIRLASENPDEQVALRALYDARPVSTFEYNASELQNMVTSDENACRARTPDRTAAAEKAKINSNKERSQTNSEGLGATIKSAATTSRSAPFSASSDDTRPSIHVGRAKRYPDSHNGSHSSACRELDDSPGVH